MAYQALYRRCRPMVFDDVIGQSHIVNTLKNEIIQNKLAHAYLFTGTRGTGKTSTAKILSRAVNCPNNKDGEPCNECDVCKGILNGSILDIIEIDAASNTGVDNIREIIEQCQYASANTKYKVYIIDEVHMLSSGAFNALLKTLEEPPSHVIFILATTEIHAVPATILSRCQRFDFSIISNVDIVSSMKKIVSSEGIMVEDDALEYVAYLGNGSMRDSLSILDRCIAYKDDDITYSDVIDIVGALDDSYLYKMAEYIAKNDVKSILVFFDDCFKSGKSLDNFPSDLLNAYREMLKYEVTDGEYNTSAKRYALIKATVGMYSSEKLIRCIEHLTNLIHDLKFVSNARVLIECTLVKMANPSFENDFSSVLDRVAQLELKVKNGVAFLGNDNKEEIVNTQEIKADETPFDNSKQENDALDDVSISDNDAGDKSEEKEEKEEKSFSDNQKTYMEVVNKWAEIIDRVQKSNRIVMYYHISEAHPIAEGERFVLTFKDKEMKNAFDNSDEKKILSEVILEITGIEVNIECEMMGKDDFSQKDIEDDDLFERLSTHSSMFPDNIKME